MPASWRDTGRRGNGCGAAAVALRALTVFSTAGLSSARLAASPARSPGQGSVDQSRGAAASAPGHDEPVRQAHKGTTTLTT